MLNSFWGKFGERINKPTTVTVQNPARLFSLISNAALDISTLRLCIDDILEAVYTSVYDNAVKGTKTNIFVAASAPAMLDSNSMSPWTPSSSKSSTMIAIVWCTSGIPANPVLPPGIFWGT